MKGHWLSFCSEWNETLARRPTAMIIFFSGTTTLTWATTFVSLSMATQLHTVLAMPEFAVGFLVMRTTSRLRMPINLAIAATIARQFPIFSELKISPLLAAFAADEETKAKMRSFRERLEESPRHSERSQRLVKGFFSNFTRFWAWAEGPIDKYGLAYFLASKASNVATLTGATYVTMQGFDVPGMLSSWGATTELQGNSGLLACTAVINVAFAPAHFYGACVAVQALERLASGMWTEAQQQLKEKEERGTLTEAEQNQLEMTESQMVTAMIGFISCLVCCCDIAFGLYIMRKLYTSQTGDSKDSKDGEDSKGSREVAEGFVTAPRGSVAGLVSGE